MPRQPKQPLLSPRWKKSVETFLQQARKYQLLRTKRCGPGSINERRSECNETSPLLALPGELRNEIWELVVFQDSAKQVELYEGYAKLYRSRSILLCCHQMKKEAEGFARLAKDRFLGDTELILYVPPSTSSNEYLEPMFQRLKALKDDDVTDIKKLTLSPPNTQVILPFCTFRKGSWYCIYYPAHLWTPRPCHIIQYNVPTKKIRESIPNDMSPHFFDKWIASCGLGINCHFRAICLDARPGRTSKDHVEAAVAATGFEKLTKEEIKFMLAFQWAVGVCR